MSPIPFAHEHFPREHASAKTTRLLGLLALVLGPLAGVPAIVLGRLVQREIVSSDGRYTGDEAAKTGVACGWVGTLVGSFAVLYLSASRSELVGNLAIAVGVLGGLLVASAYLLRSGPAPLRLLRVLADSAPAVLFSTLVGLPAVGSLGLMAKHRADAQARADAEARCANGARAAEDAIAAGRFNDAEHYLVAASGICSGAPRTYVDGLIAALPERAAEHQRKVAEEKAAREAKLAAEREQAARDRFASESDRVAGKIAAAAIRAREGKWEDADSELIDARKILDNFEGTPITKADRFVALSSNIRDERARLAPNVERIRKAREQRERQLAAMEEAKKKREEAIEAARERARQRASETEGRVCCCDGTISPTCTYVHRGCCSRHGGVCACN